MVLELDELAGSLSFTTVVLFSVLFCAGGLVVSVFCSQAARSAALAMMQISFFISWIWNAKPVVGQCLIRTNSIIWLGGSPFYSR